MKTLTLASIALIAGFSGAAFAQSMTKQDYQAQKDGISATYKSAAAGCGSFSGNAKDICKAQAKGNQSVAQADLEARYKPGLKTQYEARVARAEADYGVAREKCDDLAGNVKNVCVEQAKAAQTSAKADAKAQMKIADANQTASDKSKDAQNAAAADKRDADYAVAQQKCDAYASDAKARCLSDAKARYGKT